MTQAPQEKVSLTAPAKINLFLQVTGKREDGYHLLQSLIAFADKGDTVTIYPAENFSLTINNNTANISAGDDNLVTQTVEKLCAALGRKPDFAIALDKDIPVGAGLGGGSADAAATVKAILKFWDTNLPEEKLNNILLSLGADVPACYAGQACFVEGIGEIITPLPDFKKIQTLLVYPNIACPTAAVFKKHSAPYSDKVTLKDTNPDFLKSRKNDLTDAAITLVPEIKQALDIIESQDGCDISRMSGSGSACFGIFNTTEQSEQAAQKIQKEKPDWWIRPVILQ